MCAIQRLAVAALDKLSVSRSVLHPQPPPLQFHLIPMRMVYLILMITAVRFITPPKQMQIMTELVMPVITVLPFVIPSSLMQMGIL